MESLTQEEKQTIIYLLQEEIETCNDKEVNETYTNIINKMKGVK